MKGQNSVHHPYLQKPAVVARYEKWGRRQNPTKWFHWGEDDEVVSTEQFIRWVDGYEREHSLRTKKVGKPGGEKCAG